MKDQIVIDNALVNYYKFEGSGVKSLVFLHGWRSDSRAWFGIIKKFKDEDYTIYALDMPGFGDSGMPPKPYGISDYADIVKTFIEKKQLKNITLVGHSFGGRISICLAATYPELIDKVVLAGSAGLIPKNKNKYQMIAKIVKPFFKPNFMAGLRKSIYKMIGSEDYLATPELQETYVKITSEDLEPLLPQIKQPTLLLWGENDKETPLDFAKVMNAKIQDSKLVVFQKAGHFSFLDQPEAFTKELKDFIK